jgi:hypothetical protein
MSEHKPGVSKEFGKGVAIALLMSAVFWLVIIYGIILVME